MTAPTILTMQHRTAALSNHAVSVLEKRFLLRDENGQLIEDPAGLFRRVSRAIASIDGTYGDFRREESEEIFFDLMSSLTFLPNSPTLMNAGTSRGQLAGCFVLPIEDSMESIYGTLRDVALIQKTGGGTGFSFSHLRPHGDYIRSTRGVSSGPVSFMRLYDYSTQVNRLGGTRAGANMSVLRHDHPDILEFVNSKKDLESLSSFNISVMATDDFMCAVQQGGDVPLRFPAAADTSAGAKSSRGTINARALFDEIVANAWATGDPGLLFYDRINAANPTPHLGAIEATNPCGEQPLLPYESCNLGSMSITTASPPSSPTPSISSTTSSTPMFIPWTPFATSLSATAKSASGLWASLIFWSNFAFPMLRKLPSPSPKSSWVSSNSTPNSLPQISRARARLSPLSRKAASPHPLPSLCAMLVSPRSPPLGRSVFSPTAPAVSSLFSLSATAAKS
jgi:hypothetical protein